MALFEIVILEKPTKKGREDGQEEKVVFGPEFVVSTDGQSAAIKAIMANAGRLAAAQVAQDRMEVLVRPFK